MMIHNDDIPEKVANELANWKVEFPTSKEKSWEQLSDKIKVETPIVALNKRRSWIKVAVAASICLMVGITFMMNGGSEVDILTNNGETKEIVLPDNSKVILNASSHLAYNEEEWSENRTLKLSGEAYFEVEKGSTFSVESDHGTVQVLGTGFNVFDREDHYKVGCAHGKVSVNANGSEVILTKGLFSELNGSDLTVPRNSDYILTWTEGLFHFEEATLDEVFKEIARQFNVEVEHHVDAKRLYSGSFQTGSIERAMTVICDPMNMTFDYIEDEKKLIIKNK